MLGLIQNGYCSPAPHLQPSFFLFEVPNQIWALTLAAAQARTLAANGAQQEDMHEDGVIDATSCSVVFCVALQHHQTPQHLPERVFPK